jgi:alkylated DNA nucleotide flippase Atl1
VALVWRTDGLGRVPFAQTIEDPRHPLLCETARQLEEYFAGKRRNFELPLEFRGTEFQRRVWSALLTIPYGQTRSYRQIAEQIGNPMAVRAVGAANGRNPDCHCRAMPSRHRQQRRSHRFSAAGSKRKRGCCRWKRRSSNCSRADF